MATKQEIDQAYQTLLGRSPEPGFDYAGYAEESPDKVQKDITKSPEFKARITNGKDTEEKFIPIRTEEELTSLQKMYEANMKFQESEMSSGGVMGAISDFTGIDELGPDSKWIPHEAWAALDVVSTLAPGGILWGDQASSILGGSKGRKMSSETFEDNLGINDYHQWAGLGADIIIGTSAAIAAPFTAGASLALIPARAAVKGTGGMMRNEDVDWKQLAKDAAIDTAIAAATWGASAYIKGAMSVGTGVNAVLSGTGKAATVASTIGISTAGSKLKGADWDKALRNGLISGVGAGVGIYGANAPLVGSFIAKNPVLMAGATSYVAGRLAGQSPKDALFSAGLAAAMAYAAAGGGKMGEQAADRKLQESGAMVEEPAVLEPSAIEPASGVSQPAKTEKSWISDFVTGDNVVGRSLDRLKNLVGINTTKVDQKIPWTEDEYVAVHRLKDFVKANPGVEPPDYLFKHLPSGVEWVNPNYKPGGKYTDPMTGKVATGRGGILRSEPSGSSSSSSAKLQSEYDLSNVKSLRDLPKLDKVSVNGKMRDQVYRVRMPNGNLIELTDTNLQAVKDQSGSFKGSTITTEPVIGNDIATNLLIGGFLISLGGLALQAKALLDPDDETVTETTEYSDYGGGGGGGGGGQGGGASVAIQGIAGGNIYA